MRIAPMIVFGMFVIHLHTSAQVIARPDSLPAREPIPQEEAISPIQIVHTKKAPVAVGPYSQAVSANGFLFTAGQIPIDPTTGKVTQGDIKVQTRQVMENLKAVVEAGGSSFANVVKTTVFMKDMNEFAAMNEVYGEYFKEHPPARSTVEVARLPKDVRIEIEAVALIGNK